MRLVPTKCWLRWDDWFRKTHPVRLFLCTYFYDCIYYIYIYHIDIRICIFCLFWNQHTQFQSPFLHPLALATKVKCRSPHRSDHDLHRLMDGFLHFEGHFKPQHTEINPCKWKKKYIKTSWVEIYNFKKKKARTKKVKTAWEAIVPAICANFINAIFANLSKYAMALNGICFVKGQTFGKTQNHQMVDVKIWFNSIGFHNF